MKKKLPNDARCEICNHMQIIDGFCSCWRGNHMQDGFFRHKKPTDVCGNFSRNVWAEKNEEKNQTGSQQFFLTEKTTKGYGK